MFKTRIAPSPSGDMHIGTARTAYFNWLIARASGGKFVLRIDDTNKDKIDDSYITVIHETMAWLGLNFDELHYQSQRFGLYQKAAAKLIEQGRAKVADNGTVILTHVDLPTSWFDEVGGEIAVSNEDRRITQDMVIMRSDGSPTYHFASVYDDADLDINYIVRGVDHISNTPRQIAIYNALGITPPKFAHVGLIHQNKKKLSKRDGAASMLHYRDQGYNPEAMLNFLLRMGWGPTVDDKSTAILDRVRAIELFLTGGKMRAAPSGFDLNKLDSFNRKYKALSSNLVH